jgi:c-di-GMP-binding flagellar brake protein YcgR
MQAEERRKWARRSLPGETLVMTSPHLVVSDTLLDLSRGGLAFRYFSANPLPPIGFSLHIVREDIFISDVPVSVISDIPNGAGVFERRCGVRFSQLSPQLQKEIDSLYASLT